MDGVHSDNVNDTNYAPTLLLGRDPEEPDPEKEEDKQRREERARRREEQRVPIVYRLGVALSCHQSWTTAECVHVKRVTGLRVTGSKHSNIANFM